MADVVADGQRDGRRRSTMFNAESERLPSSPMVRLIRWWLPLALCIVGVVLLVVQNFDALGVAAFAAFVGAGTSIWLVNFLWRLGVTGDEQRDREAEDRTYLQQHGHWPDQD